MRQHHGLPSVPKKHLQLRLYLQKTVVSILLLCILCLAFWIRIQGAERLPDGQFTENDAYLYHYQANIIAERGHLPVRDMRRWLPLGRDNGQLLSLYSYTIAYIHKAFPALSLYQIQLYAPTLCFTLGLSVLLLFLSRCYGVFFAAVVGLLLTTLPGSVERSAIGFGDRDAWCWMFGVLAVTSYLWKEQIEPGWGRDFATALSGFIVFFGGMSWEAFRVFVLRYGNRHTLSVEMEWIPAHACPFSVRQYHLFSVARRCMDRRREM